MDNNEKLLEEDCLYGLYRGKLILSNNKVTFFKKKGFFNKSYKKMLDISLEEIEECYADVNYADDCVLRLRLKKDKEVYFEFPAGLVSALTDNFSTHALLQKGKTDRWVNSIILNKGKNKHKSENPLELLKGRFVKGEITKEQYQEMKRTIEEE